MADSVPAPMVPADKIRALADEMEDANTEHGTMPRVRMQVRREWAARLHALITPPTDPYAEIREDMREDERQRFVAAATPAASVPAADILALAKEFQDEADERNRATGDKRNCYEKWDAAQRLRGLVAAAEQADKGEAADTPRDDETIKCPTCGVARGWNEDGRLTRGIWTLNCVRCGSFQIEIEDAPAGPPEPVCRCGHTDPTHGWHANRPCNAHGCPCAQFEPRVPVNDEAEAGDQLFRDLATEYGFHAVEDMFEALASFRAARGGGNSDER